MPLNDLSAERINNILFRPVIVFGMVWAFTFGLYFITAQAGWVTDTVDWQYRISHLDFKTYLNLVQTHVPSLYQFTQLVTYILYKVFGFNRWAWHLLFISLHALHATFWFVVLRNFIGASGNKRAVTIAGISMLLYTVAPHLSEVIVWKASFHYLLGGLMVVLPVLWLQRYYQTGRRLYPLLAILVYFLATFSIEVFYLTPWIILSTIIYYRSIRGHKAPTDRSAILLFFIPLLVFFFAHLVLLHITTGAYIAHIGSEISQPPLAFLRKAPHYLFHILFLGRFFPNDLRQAVYQRLASPAGLSLFYGLLIILIVLITSSFRVMKQHNKPAALFFLIILMHLALLSPLWLPDSQLVAYDRYTYLMLPFFYILLVLLLSRIRSGAVKGVLITGYFLINCFFTLKVNRLWQKSTWVVDNLTDSFPDPGHKTVLLLNLPENFNGVPMIGSLKESFFKLRYNISHRPELTNKIYDVVSFNITAPSDGAHIKVINDTLLNVTLNQWGTWWWYQFQGGRSYENEAFRVNMTDPGHSYELVLRQPVDSLMLLFVNEGKWRTVDMRRRDADQF